MKKGLTEIVCILDRSGSMRILQDETITKFNDFINKQKRNSGDARVTVVLFDDIFDTIRDSVPIENIQPLTSEEYFARGWTCLNDAIGKTIIDVGNRLNDTEESERPEKVIFVIITDGAENSSREFSGEDGRRRVKDMVDHQREKYSWEFLFLGANIDAIATGTAYGAMINMCANYGHNEQGLSSAYDATANRILKMRCVGVSEYKAMDNLDDHTSH